jgi:hypothetical protein
MSRLTAIISKIGSAGAPFHRLGWLTTAVTPITVSHGPCW